MENGQVTDEEIDTYLKSQHHYEDLAQDEFTLCPVCGHGVVIKREAEQWKRARLRQST